MIRTGEQFLESIRDGRRVLCGGEMIDDLTTHPKTRGYAHAIAEYYDMHHDPEHQDVMTFVDENGERWAKHWFLPRDKQDLVARRQLGSHAAAADAEADVWKGPMNVTKNRLGKALRSLDRVARRLPGARR